MIGSTIVTVNAAQSSDITSSWVVVVGAALVVLVPIVLALTDRLQRKRSKPANKGLTSADKV